MIISVGKDWMLDVLIKQLNESGADHSVLINKLSQVYLKLQDEHNIPAADFPDVDVMREKLKKYKPKS